MTAPRLERRGARGVLVHERGQELLIERTPVRADAHRLAVADRDLDDLAELQVALVLEADIAGIDAIFVERLGAGRMIGEQLVADIVEVADQRRGDALWRAGDRGYGARPRRPRRGRPSGAPAPSPPAPAPRSGARSPRCRRCRYWSSTGRRSARPPPTVTAASPSPTRTPTVAWRGSGPKGASDIARLIAAILFSAAAPTEFDPAGSKRSAPILSSSRGRCSAISPRKLSLQCNMTASRAQAAFQPPGQTRRSPMSLAKRHALVTGSTSGIGLAIARALAKEGRGRRHQRLRRQGGDRGRARQDREGIRRQGLLQRGRHVARGRRSRR